MIDDDASAKLREIVSAEGDLLLGFFERQDRPSIGDKIIGGAFGVVVVVAVYSIVILLFRSTVPKEAYLALLLIVVPAFTGLGAAVSCKLRRCLKQVPSLFFIAAGKNYFYAGGADTKNGQLDYGSNVAKWPRSSVSLTILPHSQSLSIRIEEGSTCVLEALPYQLMEVPFRGFELRPGTLGNQIWAMIEPG